MLSAARAEAARKQEEHNQAQLHEGKAWLSRAMAERHRSNEAEFAKTMEARKDWEETTRQARHDALAAHTEYVRRHPDTDLPPLKSAEPSAHTEEEQAQLHAPAETDESRALIAAMTEHTRAANEGIAAGEAWKCPTRKTTNGRDTRHGASHPRCTEMPCCSLRHQRLNQRPR